MATEIFSVPKLFLYKHRIRVLVFRNLVILERIIFVLWINNFCWEKLMYYNSLSGDRKYINLGTLFFLGRTDFCWKEINLLKFQKNFFDRKNTILERTSFVLEEINFVDKKIVCSIPGGNSFGRKFWFWKEFILLRKERN